MDLHAFQGKEMKQYALHSGFYHRKITPEEPKVNEHAEHFFRNVRKCLHTARIEKKNWREELNKYLRNWRATPHLSTLKSAELMFPNGKFKLKVPAVDTSWLDNQYIRTREQEQKLKMKRYADNKCHVREHSVQVNDYILVPEKKVNTFTPCFKPQKYAAISIKGNMITARNDYGHVVTREASKMKKMEP